MKVSGVTFIQGRNSYTDRDGRKYAIAIHNTSNDGSAAQEAAYAATRADGVSSHFYCDGRQIIQSLDTNARAGHAGNNNGNENAVAVEITGFNSWSRNAWLANVAWDQLGRALAEVCKYYGIVVRRASVAEMQSNPKVKAFYSHDDMRRAWGGTDHTDPGPNFPWDQLFVSVNHYMTDPSQPIEGEDMNFNQDAKLTALVDLKDKMYLDTDGNPDGTGSGQDFPVALTKAIKDMQAKINTLTTGGVTQDMLNAAMVHALQDPAVLAAFGPVIEQEAFDAAQRAEDE